MNSSDITTFARWDVLPDDGGAAAPNMSLDERLDKIRSQPKLQNQQRTALVLAGVEDVLRAQAADFTPTAYFAALLALLPQCLQDDAVTDPALAHAVVYLLDLVTPHVPAPLLRSKFSQILTSIAPALTNPDAAAPLTRSAIGTLQSLLVVQDASAWSQPATSVSPRRALAGLLTLATSPGPKIRKRALDALQAVLRNPPPSPSLDHPASDQCSSTALQVLSAHALKASAAKRGSKSHPEHDPDLIHSLQLVKAVASAANGWPTRQIDALVEVLLTIAKSTSEYLVMAAFDVFEILFQGLADEVSSAKLPRLLEVIGELQPSKDDAQLLPAWIAVLSRAYDVAGQVEPEETFPKLPGLFEQIGNLLASGSYNIRVSASECLVSFLGNCVPRQVILDPSIMDEKVLESLAARTESFLTVKYQAAWMDVFNVISAMFEALRWRANPVMTNILKAVGDLRTNDAFAGKKEADLVISAALRGAGPDFVLQVLPLNLTKPVKGAVGRAWMLPLMRTAVRNTKLVHFRQELVPLSEAMYQRVMDHGDAAKTMEIKIFETIVQQVWDTLPGYCDSPLDVTEAFDQSFAELLANLLYQQPQLRTNLCRALQLLVTSNQALLALEGEEDLLAQGRVTKAQAQSNLTHLATFASNLLAVLFNVYAETLPQHRGLILLCVNAYLSIIPETALIESYNQVFSLLSTALESESSQTQAAKQKVPTGANSTASKMPPQSHTLLDLLVTMSPHLPLSTYPSLFELSSSLLARPSDPQLQKKAYKLIPRLASTPHGLEALSSSVPSLTGLLLNSAPHTSAPAKHDRLVALSTVIPLFPSDALAFIPTILSSVVLALKEANEKTRTAAFDLLVLMAHRMAKGGTVHNSQVPNMDPNAPSVPASLQEYITMLSAGLADSNPHNISASITALARVLYEFRADLPESTTRDMVETIDLFLTSNNREIVSSCLGFVKVCVLSVDKTIMTPKLPTLVPNLCRWSGEHKAHFRAKVKHILERTVKRFGAEQVERHTPEEHKKLVKNIRKGKEREKRKRAEASSAGVAAQAEADDDRPSRARFDSGYDEAVYGSDDDDDVENSESDVSDDGVLGGRAVAKGKARAGARRDGGGGTYITETSDEPLDLLDRRALAHVSTTKPSSSSSSSRRGGPRLRTTKAKTDTDGKLIFKDDDDGDDGASGPKDNRGEPGDGTLQGGINAYVEAIRSENAPRRGQGGKLKFKNVRDARDGGGGGEEEEEVEVDEGDVREAMAKKGKGTGKKDGGKGRGKGKGREVVGKGKVGKLNGRRGFGVEKRRAGVGGGGGGGGGGGVRKRAVQVGRTSKKFRPKSAAAR